MMLFGSINEMKIDSKGADYVDSYIQVARFYHVRDLLIQRDNLSL